MKISAGLFLTDLLPEKRRLLNYLITNRVFSKELTHNETLTKLRHAGVDGIELFLPSFAKKVDKQDFQIIKEVIQANKMQVFSVHQTLRFLTKTRIPEIVELFQIADFLGAKVIVLHINLVGKQIFNKEYIAKLHALEKRFGILIGFENREKGGVASFRPKYTWEATAFAEILRKNDFHITLDTTHLGQTGADIVTFFKKNKDKIINIHISDYKEHIFNTNIRPFRYKHLALGKGELPMKAFLQALKEEKYHGLVTMEIHTDLEGFSASATMIDNLARK